MTQRPADALDLPDGGWVSVKKPSEITNRERKLLQRHGLPLYALRGKLKEKGVTDEQLEADAIEAVAGNLDASDLEVASTAQAAYIVAYTKAWSLDLDLPTMDTVDDLPAPIFDVIAKATAQLGDGTVDTEPNPSRSSPTSPSRASSTRARAGAASK